MTDVFTKKKRSEIMRGIQSKDTQPELVIRKALHALGYRYVLHDKRLPGKPDIVLSKHKTVIQVRGCFWHQHGCKKSTVPKSNIEYWKNKLQKNRNRDKKNDKALSKLGWKVIIVWECETKGSEKLEKTVNRVIKELEES